MATSKQASYIRHLLIDHGHMNAQYDSFYSTAKCLPNGPTMRERSGSVQAWLDRLTPRQASEVISALAK